MIRTLPSVVPAILRNNCSIGCDGVIGVTGAAVSVNIQKYKQMLAVIHVIYLVD